MLCFAQNFRYAQNNSDANCPSKILRQLLRYSPTRETVSMQFKSKMKICMQKEELNN